MTPSGAPATPPPVAIIQARMTSTRLPGKVLADVGGAPLLERMIGRVRGARRLGGIVVATTARDSDDPVAALCGRLDVPVFRGDEADVLSRFAGAAAMVDAGAVARLTADCPMIDPGVIDDVVAVYRRNSCDYVSNTRVRSYPDGLDVEVFSRASLDEACREALHPHLREHVTPYIHGARPDLPNGGFRVRDVVHEPSYGHLRWTVDTALDLEKVRLFFATLPDGFAWHDALALELSDPSRFTQPFLAA